MPQGRPPGTTVPLYHVLRFDLVPTGGSDFHGRSKPDLAIGTGLGDLDVPDDRLDQLAARRPG